jgi:hypothetical protein
MAFKGADEKPKWERPKVSVEYVGDYPVVTANNKRYVTISSGDLPGYFDTTTRVIIRISVPEVGEKQQESFDYAQKAQKKAWTNPQFSSNEDNLAQLPPYTEDLDDLLSSQVLSMEIGSVSKASNGQDDNVLTNPRHLNAAAIFGLRNFLNAVCGDLEMLKSNAQEAIERVVPLLPPLTISSSETVSAASVSRDQAAKRWKRKTDDDPQPVVVGRPMVFTSTEPVSTTTSRAQKRR